MPWGSARISRAAAHEQSCPRRMICIVGVTASRVSLYGRFCTGLQHAILTSGHTHVRYIEQGACLVQHPQRRQPRLAWQRTQQPRCRRHARLAHAHLRAPPRPHKPRRTADQGWCCRLPGARARRQTSAPQSGLCPLRPARRESQSMLPWLHAAAQPAGHTKEEPAGASTAAGSAGLSAPALPRTPQLGRPGRTMGSPAAASTAARSAGAGGCGGAPPAPAARSSSAASSSATPARRAPALPSAQRRRASALSGCRSYTHKAMSLAS